MVEPVQCDMRTKNWNAAMLIIALGALGWLCLARVSAQSGTPPNSALITTNWLGYLVFGSEETIDRIAPGAYPRTDRQVEIGLRSDGVVVWRAAGR
jgi:hypothetical protein